MIGGVYGTNIVMYFHKFLIFPQFSDVSVHVFP